MGYDTQFEGTLFFSKDPSSSESGRLSEILGEDSRDHKNWDVKGKNLCVNLELTENHDGLVWDGTEKTYDLEEVVNLVIRLMRKDFPDFGFKIGSKMLAQGEDIKDRWMLVIGKDGWAYKEPIEDNKMPDGIKLYVLYDRNFEHNAPDLTKKMGEAFQSSDGRLTVHWIGKINSVQTYPKAEDWYTVAITFGGRWVAVVGDPETEQKINLHYFNMRQHSK